MQNQSTALCGPENSSIHNTKHHNTRIQRERERERERVASVVITVSHNQYEKSHIEDCQLSSECLQQQIKSS